MPTHVIIRVNKLLEIEENFGVTKTNDTEKMKDA
jgi:hypothetical protein